MITGDDDIPVLLAETIKDALNTAFVGDFVAQNRMLPEFDLKQLKNLIVSVVPGPLEASELLTENATIQNDWLVAIGFQKQVQRGSDDETRQLLQLVKRVRRHLNQNRVIDLGENGGEFCVIDIAHNPYVAHDLLLKGEFFSALELTIRDWEDIDE